MIKIIFFIFIFLKGLGLFAQDDTVNYSFFAAGHTYGNPNSIHYGLHYPFVDFIPFINNYPKMNLGFLVGDVVVTGTLEYWDSAQTDMAKLDMPIYIAAGNHDIGIEFVKRFGEYYYSFNYNNDLFIILTPGLNSWNISGQQLDFLEETLEKNHEKVNNIFIFMHELVWWSPTNVYKNVIINYKPYYPGSTNFDSIVKPLLLSYSNNITIYAGDLGCTSSVSSYMYHHFNNITLIGTGMGGAVKDNIIITDVYNDSVHHNLVAINGNDINALGEIYDFSLDTFTLIQTEKKINVYPTISNQGYFYIENKFLYDFDIQIFNLHGEQIYTDHIQKNSLTKMETTNMKSGIYFIQLNNDWHKEVKKIIIQ